VNFHVNEHIAKTVRVFPQQERYGLKRYDMNENPEGLPKAFVDSVLAEITPEFLSIYPEPDRFQKKYADFVGVKMENVLATNGSDMGIRYLFEVFGEVGKEVVTVAPSFEMYWVNCCILGLKHVPVPYEPDMTMDIEKVLAAIGADTRIVVLLNPNNPVGNVYTEDEVSRVIAKAQSVGAIVIIDEAYHYFYEGTFLRKAVEEENVVVLRTFSKLFSIAACRLGVMISQPQIIQYVKNAKLTFDVNAIALLFGERILEHPELTEELIRTEREGRKWILAELRKLDYECRDCKGNYIFVKPRCDAHEVTRRLENEHQVLVHAYRHELLKPYIRVSVGSVSAMQVFLDAFLAVDKEA